MEPAEERRRNSEHGANLWPSDGLIFNVVIGMGMISRIRPEGLGKDRD